MANTTKVTTKVTKKDMFNEVIAIAKSLDRQDIVDFAKHEIELLEKKASKSSQTKTQKENEVLMKKIFEALEIVGRPVTITELQTEVTEMSEYSNQKLSALLKKLKDCGKVKKTVDKKKSYFSIPTTEGEGK